LPVGGRTLEEGVPLGTTGSDSMSERKSFDDIKKARPRAPGYQKRVADLRRAMDTALALAAVRQARGMTQVELAERMGRTQGNVSRIEHGEDLYLSTLREFVESLGGRLELNAVFEDQVVPLLHAASTRHDEVTAVQ
jgi:ribosome-binding protein aMBF1 (putative translation factor)